MNTLRWNALLGEWVIVTPERAQRPFQDPEHPCPFCPGQPETAEGWDVLTLSNRYAALSTGAGLLPMREGYVMETPAYGECRVIVLSPNHDEQIERMDEKQLVRVFEEYVRVREELGSIDGIEYVLIFENRGRAIGVSLDHPHAQAYALPFVPPRIERELRQFDKVWKSEGECLLCQTIEGELKSGDRVVTQDDEFVAIVPFAARLPYEVHIYPRRHVRSLSDLGELLPGLARMVQDIVRRYVAVFDELAYVMVLHDAPVKPSTGCWHFHVEMYPPWRDRRLRKYLAGVETGAWTYTNDSLPEDRAHELREAI